MNTANLSDLLRRLTRKMAAEMLYDESDGQLVNRALATRDEAALQAIVFRHGAMVYRVCWRVLQHAQDAEDAFQATFLVLARKLSTVRKHASLASWLHGVAHRVALKARSQSASRRRHEQRASLPDALPSEEATWGELRSALDAELGQLPDKWRLPLILCYLEGRTQEESARQLGWSKSTLRRRLEEARAALGSRLKGRGVAWPAALAAVLLSDCIASAAPAQGLFAATVEAAAGVAAGKTVPAAASAKVAALTEGVLKTMWMTKFKTVTATLLMMGLIAFAGGLLTHQTGTAQLQNVAKTLPEAGKTEDAGKKAEDLPGNKAADASAALKKARVVAGRKAYDTIWGWYEYGWHDEEQVYRWSVRLLDAERELAATKAERVTAVEGHLKRMKKLGELAQKRPIIGSPPPALRDAKVDGKELRMLSYGDGKQEQMFVADFPRNGIALLTDYYRTEAEVWLLEAKAK